MSVAVAAQRGDPVTLPEMAWEDFPENMTFEPKLTVN